jgi:hypothetical protein
MYINEETAIKIKNMAFEIDERLNVALDLLRENCPENEIENLRQSVFDIKGQVYVLMLHPVFEQHPSLRIPYNEETDKPLLQKIVNAAVAKGITLSDESLEAIAKHGLTMPDSSGADNQPE